MVNIKEPTVLFQDLANHLLCLTPSLHSNSGEAKGFFACAETEFAMDYFSSHRNCSTVFIDLRKQQICIYVWCFVCVDFAVYRRPPAVSVGGYKGRSRIGAGECGRHRVGYDLIWPKDSC